MVRVVCPGLLVLVTVVVAIASAGGCTRFRDYVHNGFKVGPEYCPPDAFVAEQWLDAGHHRTGEQAIWALKQHLAMAQTDAERKQLEKKLKEKQVEQALRVVEIRGDTEDLDQWWRVFNDPVIECLVHEAAQQNLTLREAGHRILQARNQLGIVTGKMWPQQQEALGSFRHTQEPSSAVGASVFDQWHLGASLAWELDFWGRFRRAVLHAEAQFDAALEDYDDALVLLVGDVATNYVQMRVAQQQMMVTRDNVRLQKRALAETWRKVNFGVRRTTLVDPNQAEANLMHTESQIPTFQIAERQAQNRLCILLGRPPVDLRGEFEVWKAVDQRKEEYVKRLDDLITLHQKLVTLEEEKVPAGEHLRIDDLWEIGKELELPQLEKLQQEDLAAGEDLLRAEYSRRVAELRQMERQYATDLGQNADDEPVDALLSRTDAKVLGSLLNLVDLWRRKLTVYVPLAPTVAAAGIPADLLRRRPDVRMAERAVAAQAQQVGIAVADLYPAISITGSLGYSAAQFPDLFSSRAFNGSVGPSFQWNVLNYGRLVNNIRLQDAKLRELVVTYQAVALQASEEVENGLILFLRSQQRASSLRESVLASKAAVDEALRLYEDSTKELAFDFNRLSTVQLDLVQRQDALAQAQGQIALGLIQVYRGLGGGWGIPENPPATPVAAYAIVPAARGHIEDAPPSVDEAPEPPEFAPPRQVTPLRIPQSAPAARPAAND